MKIEYKVLFRHIDGEEELRPADNLEHAYTMTYSWGAIEVYEFHNGKVYTKYNCTYFAERYVQELTFYEDLVKK